MSKVLERFVSYIRRAKTQEQILKYLRTLRFEFLTYEALVTLYPKIHIRPMHRKYQFMVRFSPEARKGFDIRLIVGIKIVGPKVEKIIIYRDTFLSSIEVKPWAKIKRVNFKKVKQRVKFDAVMTYKERRIWRNEHEKLVKNSKLKPSEFYLKNQQYVHFL